MLFTIGFLAGRFAEILTLIPIMGMLAYFVDGYVKYKVNTPDYILVLFVVSVIALAWAISTLFLYHRSSKHARFVALIDIGFVGALIAGVYYLRYINSADCSSYIPYGSSYDLWFGLFGRYYGGYEVDPNKTCALLKASFALGIMNTVFFFSTAVLAWIHGRHLTRDRPDASSKRYHRETHYARRGHRRRRSSHGSRGSHSSRRSSHSHSRSHRQVQV